MKKFFLMIMVMVMTLSAQAQEKVWDFSTWDVATFTETTTIDGLTIAATATASVSIDASNKSLFLPFTKRLKLGGTGKAESRNISFDVSGRSLIIIAFSHGSSSGDPRGLCLAKNDFSNVVKTTTVGANVISYLTYYQKGGESTYYAYSNNSGINIHGIYVKSLDSDVVNVYDFAAEADADNNPTKMNTGNTFYVWMKNEAGNYCKQPNNWRGYSWSEGSLLPKCDFVFTQSTQINNMLVKNNPVSGWKQSNETRPIVIAGVTAGMKVTVDYDASQITDPAKKQLIWASATGQGSDFYTSSATIGGATTAAVAGGTTVPSGYPIHITKAEGGYIALMPFTNMVIQKVTIEMEEDTPTYLGTTDFNSMDDLDISEVPASLKAAIEGLDIVDKTTGTGLNISGSGSDETPNRYAVNGNKVALELNGGVLDFVAPEGYGIKKITFVYEEWNEANSADAGVEVEGTGIEVDEETKTAVWEGSSPEVKVNIAGKTVIKSIKIEVGERDGEPLVVDVADGANLNSIVDKAYAQNPYLGKVTLNLAKDGKYTVDGSLFVSRPLVINGAEGAEIDAAASKDPFILMRPLPEIGLNANGAYEISEISIKDVKITGLKNRLFYANRQNYLIGKLAVENSVIQMDGTTPRSIFDFYCGGNYKELSIEGSTLYADPSNAMRGGLVSTQSSKSIIELGGESQKLSIKNSTLYNIAYGKTPVLLQRHSQYYLSFELAGNVIVNCGEKGNFVAGLNEGQKSSEVKWVVDSNAFNFDGEDSGANEAYGNALSGVVKFADAAKGDFTQSNVAAGDPRWISGTPTAIETVKTAEETSLENAVIYNLNGQSVDKAQKGLYIVNGKKVVIK